MDKQYRTIKLTISYDGTNYSGWQKQRTVKTIQGEIEKCLCTMTTEDTSLHGAGRTDAGVHALAMTAHFSCLSRLSCQDYLTGLNSMLPLDIRVLNVTQTAPDFHARFSATGKRYRYTIFNGEIQSPMDRLYTHHVKARLDRVAMRECLLRLIGTHDFSSFENTGTRDKSITTGKGAVRTIHSANLQEEAEDKIILEFIGDGFLKNMVRNLAGTIIDAGKGKITAKDFSEILQAKDRTKARETAPAHGLTLVEVFYDS